MARKSVDDKTAVIIPAYNEALVLSDTLKAVKNIVKKEHIYVIDDGSKDKTSKIALRYTDNVLILPNSGKASALNQGIAHFNIAHNYHYILLMDADTRPDKKFLKYIIPIMEKNKKVQIAVGRVEGRGNSWVEKYRIWEYQISHFIHKQAQAFMSAIIVVPGCATVYRSKILRNNVFPTGTLTEDMDFTFQLHRRGYNHMVFVPQAVVYTQDPNNLKDFLKQITRWYTGFWQAVKKHNIPWGGQTLDFEVTLMAIEGLYNSILAFMLIFFFPSVLVFNYIHVLKYPILLDLGLFFIPSLLWVSIRIRSFKLFPYIFHFYFLRFLSSLVFIRSFFQGYLSYEKNYSWDTTRYKINKGD